MKALSLKGKPIVTVASRYDNLDVYGVRCDNRGGMMAATRHLIGLGHRRIAFVGDLGNAEFEERFEGYREALERAGIPYDDGLLYDTAGGQAAAKAIVEAGVPVTAVAAAADFFALQMMDVFRKAGIAMPDRIAITGFDDIGAAAKTAPALTTVRQPIIEIGRMGLEIGRASCRERV